MLFLDCSTALRSKLPLNVSPKCDKTYKDWKQFKLLHSLDTSRARSSNIYQLSLRASNCIIQIIAMALLYALPC